MNDKQKYCLILFIVVGLSCALLAYVNSRTEPFIKKNQEKAQNEARMLVFPDAQFERGKDNPYIDYYLAFGYSNELLGYTFIAKDKGWSGGYIETMVGVCKDMRITRITVLRHSETPGLGANASRNDFTDRFRTLSRDQLRIDKDGGRLVSITGATITSRVIVNSIKYHGLDKLIKALEYIPTDVEVEDD